MPKEGGEDKLIEAMKIKVPDDQGNIFTSAIQDKMNIFGLTLEEAEDVLRRGICDIPKDQPEMLDMLDKAVESIKSYQRRN